LGSLGLSGLNRTAGVVQVNFGPHKDEQAVLLDTSI